MPVKKLHGYPQVEGAKIATVVNVDGPASYATGGQTLEAAQLGLKYIEHVECSLTDNGAHQVVAKFTTKSPATSVKLVYINVGGASSGAEVAAATNLSARFARLRVIGS